MPRYQGSGSSRINPKFIDNLWYRLEQRGFAARYADGYEPIMGETSERLLRDAEQAAAHADVAVVVAGLPARYESEGFDRKLMTMPKGQVELIERVCAVNPRTVVVLQGGAPMEIPWRDKPAAILLMYLSGWIDVPAPTPQGDAGVPPQWLRPFLTCMFNLIRDASHRWGRLPHLRAFIAPRCPSAHRSSRSPSILPLRTWKRAGSAAVVGMMTQS